MESYKRLYSLLERELDEIAQRGEISSGTLDVIYKITCSMKCLKKMMHEEEYSGRYSRDGSYNRSYENRYDRDWSRDGYSRGSLREHLEGALRSAKDEHTRNEIMRMLDRM